MNKQQPKKKVDTVRGDAARIGKIDVRVMKGDGRPGKNKNESRS